MKKGNEIRDALIHNPDSEKLSLLFCEKVRETKEFQDQVTAVYTFISQNLEAKSPYENRSLQPLSNQDRGVEKKGMNVVDWYVTKEQFFYNLIIPNHNDVNTWYKCNYSFTYYWQIKDEDSKEEGLHYLTLKLLNTTEQVTIGTNEFTSEK
ncbi:MAG: hypothetical protein K2H06_01040 [Anaeroplasmataceae bacterium]|nr:hypothetical protein [Anaeroplasmataceae bacterium]